MIAATDVAEKAAEVWVEEIRGICPQHFTMIAILGDIAEVGTALEAVRKRSWPRWRSNSPKINQHNMLSRGMKTHCH
jgi:microcompartment protein CcmL/EutN